MDVAHVRGAETRGVGRWERGGGGEVCRFRARERRRARDERGGETTRRGHDVRSVGQSGVGETTRRQTSDICSSIYVNKTVYLNKRMGSHDEFGSLVDARETPTTREETGVGGGGDEGGGGGDKGGGHEGGGGG